MTNLDSPELHPLIALSHELKAPLTVIAHIAADLMECTELSEGERLVAIERIRLTADRSLRLARGLTVSGRLTQDSQLAFGFRLEPLNIVQLCDQVIDELVPLARACHQTIQARYAPRKNLIIGNRELIQSVLCNLLDNSLRHSPAGTTVAIDIKPRGEMLRVGVQDNGPGVKASELQRLAVTLGRQLQPLGGRSGSSGLGLYIASTLLQAMGGRLGLARSKSGAVFYADLLASKQLALL